MDTLIVERGDKIILTTPAQVVKIGSGLAEELAASRSSWRVEKSNPYLKWVAGSYMESDRPNENGQFWAKDDVVANEHTIRFSPLNMVHKTRQPVGFVHSTKQVEVDDAAQGSKRVRIDALSAAWSHVFPFESALIDAADERSSLFLSLECVGTHLTCAGDQGCGKTFEYAKTDSHCDHLIARSSVRHIVNPTFRGCALIIPPIEPGWSGAKAKVLDDVVVTQAQQLAAASEQMYLKVLEDRDLSPGAWESLMAMVVSLAHA